MTYDLSIHCANGGTAEKKGGRWRLTIPAGSTPQYRVAQLEDYTGLPRWRFPARPPRTLSLRARVSDDFAAGTWGFGFWNDPFGASLRPFRPLPTLPNAAWFFYASPQNYLSFREDKPPNGFNAQVFSSRNVDARLILVGLALPYSRHAARRRLGRIIDEDAAALAVDPTQWHAYRLRWDARAVVFEVDNGVILESRVSPRPPLGLVIWIDNQYAAFTPEGKIAWGVLKTAAPAWLEIEDVTVSA